MVVTVQRCIPTSLTEIHYITLYHVAAVNMYYFNVKLEARTGFYEFRYIIIIKKGIVKTFLKALAFTPRTWNEINECY